jgi:hypothetical protein
MLAEIERAAATLLRDTSYAFLVNAEPLSLDFVTQQFEQPNGFEFIGRR